MSLRSTRHPPRRSGALTALALAAALLTFVAVALAAGPKSGHYSGTGSIYNGEAKSTLPISFNLKGRKLSALALGPAQLACAGGSTGQATLTMPKLTGFPTERLADGAVGDYTYYFAQQAGAFTSIGSSGAPPHGALYVQVFAAFYGGKKFPVARRHPDPIQRRRQRHARPGRRVRVRRLVGRHLRETPLAANLRVGFNENLTAP